MTSEQRDIALIVYLSLAWTSSWTNSWVASNESSMLRVIRSRDSSPFTTVQWCFFNVNQKSFWTNSRVYTMNVMYGGDIENVPLIDIEYWWFLGWTNRPVASHFQWKNQQIHCPHKPWYLFFSLFWKSCWTNRWVFLIRNLNLCEQSVICQVQLNYDLMLSTTDDQDPVISYDLNFGHDVFAINTV